MTKPYTGDPQTDCEQERPIPEKTHRCDTCGRHEEIPVDAFPVDQPIACCFEELCGGELHEVTPGQRAELYLNAYRVTRAFGGPEEGGWWYDVGEPLASVPLPAFYRSGPDGLRPRAVPDEEDLSRRRLETFFGTGSSENQWRRLSGVWIVFVVEDRFARPYPARRPRYE